jgi:copper homeostasis protein
MRAVRQVEGLKMHVLIRPRGGDFLYDKAEVATMTHDIEQARLYGADGVVIGALRADGLIDMDVCRQLADAASGMAITFHRAFDMCKDPLRAIQEIRDLGCYRLLTSGQASTALEGLPLLKQLTSMQTGVIIMPGCGVKSSNVAEIIRGCNATEVHASARKSFASPMCYRPESVKMGNPDQDEFARCETDADEVSAIVSELAQFA